MHNIIFELICKTHNYNDERVETKNLKNGVFYICFESLFRSTVLSINTLSGTCAFNIILSIVLSVCVIRTAQLINYFMN